MWSVGCILGELIVGKAIFPGTSTLNQIERVLELTGKPKMEDIEAIESDLAMNVLSNMNVTKKRSFQSFFPNASDDALDLLKKLLVFNPKLRLTAEETLRHKYVRDFSCPEEETVCPRIIEISMNDNKKFSIKEYREALYNDISKRKKDERKKWQQKYLSQLGVPEGEKGDKKTEGISGGAGAGAALGPQNYSNTTSQMTSAVGANQSGVYSNTSNSSQVYNNSSNSHPKTMSGNQGNSNSSSSNNTYGEPSEPQYYQSSYSNPQSHMGGGGSALNSSYVSHNAMNNSYIREKSRERTSGSAAMDKSVIEKKEPERPTSSANISQYYQQSNKEYEKKVLSNASNTMNKNYAAASGVSTNSSSSTQVVRDSSLQKQSSMNSSSTGVSSNQNSSYQKQNSAGPAAYSGAHHVKQNSSSGMNYMVQNVSQPLKVIYI